MKKIFLTLLGVLMATSALAQNTKQAPLPVVPSPAPQQKQATPAPAPVVPAQPAPQPQAVQQPPAIVLPEMDEETAEALGNMRAFLGHDFDGQLKFLLTEEKMIDFIRVASKIEKINSKWDVQIAGAETDQMAVEYNNFAAEELDKVIKKMVGLTQDEYTQMVKLSVNSADFSSLYRAYKQLVSEGYFGPDPLAMADEKVQEVVKPAAIVGVAPAPDVPAAPPRKGEGAKPPAKPANPDTAPAPQGSPKPPYSPPVSR